MPEVQNVGAVDYAQYQPSQYSNDVYTEDYNSIPEVYDEKAEQIKSASKSRLGATVLSLAVVGGLALWGGYAWGSKKAVSSNEAAELYEKAQKAMEEVEKIADDHAGKFFGKNRIGRDFYNKIKELFAPFKKGAGEVKEEVTEEAANAAKDKGKSSLESKKPTHS